MGTAGTTEILHRSISSRWGVALLFVLSFLYFLSGITQVVDVYDEGIPVYGAQRVLEGDVPYRDFWTIYAPGQFYVLAGLFKLFGSSLLVERLCDTAIRALVSMVAFVIVLALASPGWGIAIWLISTLWLKYFGYYASSYPPALLFILASSLALMTALDQAKPRFGLILAGALAAVAGVFRHDFGAYAFVAEVLIIVFYWFRKTKLKAGRNIQSSAKPGVLAYLLSYLLGFGLISLPVLIYFLAAVPAGKLRYDLVTFPLKIFPIVRKLPFPAPLPDVSSLMRGEMSLPTYLTELSITWAFYFPPLVLAGAFFFFIYNRPKPGKAGRGEAESAWKWKVGLFGLLALLSFNSVRIRADLAHLLPSFVSSGVVAAVLGSRLWNLRSVRRGWLLGIGLAAFCVFLIYPIYEWLKPGMDESFRQFLYSHNLKRAGPVGVNPYQADAIHYIQGVTYPWEPIFVGNNRHDLIYNNDVMFYFLSERRCASAYQELSPGSATSPAVQNEIINALRQNNVRCVVLLSRFENPGVTNELVPVRLLDDFIAQNYQPVEKFGDWSVWKAK